MILLTTCKFGLDSVPIPEFAVYHDPFIDQFPDPFHVLVLSESLSENLLQPISTQTVHGMLYKLELTLCMVCIRYANDLLWAGLTRLSTCIPCFFFHLGYCYHSKNGQERNAHAVHV